MRECRHDHRLSGMHAGEQQAGLPVEQLQDLALEAAVAQRHARELAEVDCRGRRGRFLVDDLGRELRHETLPRALRPFCRRAL